MADVRQLLKAERANRRLTHPHASYTKDGKLLCNLCEIPIKNESQWQSHLHSTQHLLRSQRAKEAESARSTGAKKRKAESPTSDAGVDDRKRVRASEEELNVDEGQTSGAPSTKIAKVDQEAQKAHSEATAVQSTTASQPRADIDETELAAFEQELADLEKESTQAQTNLRTSSALNAGATISAAPISAEELAAQASEEQSTQKGRRDAEIEAEKEDAARALEDELDEMRELEGRVRKLREQREALRIAKDSDVTTGDALDNTGSLNLREGTTNGTVVAEEEDNDDDDEYDDEWTFGGS